MFEAARGILSETHTQIVEVWHGLPDDPAAFQLDVVGGSLAFDEAWAPHAMLRVTCRIPDEQADLDRIDPRTGSRIVVLAGYEVAGSRVVERVATLYLDSRSAARPDDTMELVAMGDELRVQDWSPVEGVRVIPLHATAGEALAGLIQWTNPLPGVTVTVDPGLDVPFFAADDEAMRLDAASDVWDAITDIADRAGELWVYESGLGAWRVTRRPTEVGRSAAILNVGENGTVLDSSASLSRAEWANTVIVVHEWRTEAGVDERALGWAQVNDGPMSPANVGTKAITYRRTNPATPASASAAARSLLTRAATRGRTVSLRAVAAWWLRPGDTASVRLPQGPSQRLLVSRVEFGLTDGRMSVGFRHPETFTITNGE